MSFHRKPAAPRALAEMRLIVWPYRVLGNVGTYAPRCRARSCRLRPQLLCREPFNWSWHEYEMRVAFWRLKAMFESPAGSSRAHPSIRRSATVYREVAEACRDADWEFIAHAVTQRPLREISDEAAMVRQCVDEITQFQRASGRAAGRARASRNHARRSTTSPPPAWNMRATGYFDDQPFEIATKHGPLVGLPYTVNLNDVPQMVIARHPIQTFQAIDLRCVRLPLRGSRGVGADHDDRAASICLRDAARNAPYRRRVGHMQRPGVVFWSGDKNPRLVQVNAIGAWEGGCR